MISRRDVLRGAAAASLAVAAGRIPASDVERAGTGVRAKVLGVAQDGGVPHLGCSRQCCIKARHDPSHARKVACMGLISEPGSRIFLIDATPDLESQIHELRRASGIPEQERQPVDGILLTHAHVGHYAGLIHLGKEAMATRMVPLHASPLMCSFISANKPWSRLVDWGHVKLQPMEPGGSRQLAVGLTAEALQVPHRDEDSDTLGFIISGPERKLLYVPDTNQWSRWPVALPDLLAKVDFAFLDGSFFSAAEVTWRDPAEIPHPTIRQSMDLLETVPRSRRADIFFTHLNHSNPALDVTSEAAAIIERRGFSVARRGMELEL
jgi:pyrroloquinoline quinone biosynthesis protein B